MFDVGGGELLFILLIILLLFGPKKIPELMRSVGTGIRHFRRAQEDLTQQIRDLSTQDPTIPSARRTVTVMHDDTPAEPTADADDQVVTPTPAEGAAPRPPKITPSDDTELA